MKPLTLSKLAVDRVPGKRIKSTDPRKAEIVAMFKEACGGTKITELSERKGSYYARVLTSDHPRLSPEDDPLPGGRHYQCLGVWEILPQNESVSMEQLGFDYSAPRKAGGVL